MHPTLIFVFEILCWSLIVLTSIIVLIALYDRFFQTKNIIMGNFPFLGRFRYLFHELRPFFRQYFGDDDSFAPRSIVDWILHVANGKTGYFSFDKFDTTFSFHDGSHQMIHASTPLNMDEMKPIYPVLGEKRDHPFAFQNYFYRSAMSLGSIGFEATSAMSAACADAKTPFNTGEGALSIHHLPRLKFSFEKKFLKYKRANKLWKVFSFLAPGRRMKNRILEIMGNFTCGKDFRDLYIFCPKHWLFYTINWDAPLSAFPKPEDLTDEYGQIILQIGSGLYGLRKKRKDDIVELDWERFKKVTSFVRAIEIKLAQGAKQTGGILKAVKNTPAIAAIRGIHAGIDLVSPNRFPFYDRDKEDLFLDFIEDVSTKSGGKPVGAKVVISNNKNVEGLFKAMAARPASQGLDFITFDGGDGGTGAAPIALGVLFGKKIYEALPMVNELLQKYKFRDRVKILASSKLYAPHMSARALALGADGIGNARSIMIAGGCIRAGVCSGEEADCPVGLATMKLSKRRAYAQAWDQKVQQIQSYIKAHNKGLIQVAAVVGVSSPSELKPEHIAQG